MYDKIKSELEKKLIGKQLTDAHRHSLYDIDKIKNIENLSVEEWSENNDFLQYQNKTKQLYGNELFDEMQEWLEFSANENIRTILDFSAKHASDDLKRIYDRYKIKSFSPLKWNKLSKINHNFIPQFVILPDERLLTDDIIKKVLFIKKQYPTIKFTMHCLESKQHKKIALNKFGISTIEWLDKYNMLDEKLYLVHVNEVSINDIDLIRQNNVKVILCPLMRVPLKYRNASIPLDLDIYFGTDAPLISKKRSLLDTAIFQAEIWIEEGVLFDKAINTTIKSIVNTII